MKRSLLFVVLFFVLVVTTGCNGGSEKVGGVESYVMRIAYASKGDPQDEAGEFIKCKFEEKLGGRIKVETYPAGQLGSNDTMMQQVQEGTIEATLCPPAFLGGRFEPLTILDLPYFLDIDLLKSIEILNGPVGEELSAGMNDLGMVVLRFYPQGYRMVFTNFPIEGLGSFQGKKIRAMQCQTQVDMYNGWGASGVPMGTPELYSALQQHVVDGTDTVAPFAYTMKYHDVCSHIYKAPYVPMPVLLIANKKWFDSLPEDLRADMLEVLADDAELQKRAMQIIDGALEALQDEGGMELVVPEGEELELLRQKAKVVHDNFLKANPDTKIYYDRIVDAVKEAQG